MDWQKANIAIKKINALHKSMAMGNGKVTSIERDLMLNYIRQLYELFLEQDVEEIEGVPSEKAESLSDRSAPEFEIVDKEKDSEPTPAEEPKPEKPAPPKIIEIPESIKELEKEEAEQQDDSPVFNSPAPPRESQKVRPPAPQRPPEQKKEPVRPASYNKAELEGLFDFKTGGELADKLSDQPLSDLTKALSINDRLLYMNQLFGKDMSELDDSLKLLNRFENLQEAKSLIYNLAEQYDWTHEEKMDVAKDFLKLVRRRYL
jgi:hypothetical protein